MIGGIMGHGVCVRIAGFLISYRLDAPLRTSPLLLASLRSDAI